MPTADQLTVNELFLLENAFLREGHIEHGKWCALQFGQEP